MNDLTSSPEIQQPNTLEQRRVAWQAHVSSPDASNNGTTTFEEWLNAELQETRVALQALYDKLSEYDMITELEESAQEIDRRDDIPPDPAWGYALENQEWAEVLGIIEDAKVVLGIVEIDP